MARTFTLEVIQDICAMIGIDERKQKDGQYFTRQELIHLHGFVTATCRKDVPSVEGGINKNGCTKEGEKTEKETKTKASS